MSQNVKICEVSSGVLYDKRKILTIEKIFFFYFDNKLEIEIEIEIGMEIGIEIEIEVEI